jgi:hypothetical protein
MVGAFTLKIQHKLGVVAARQLFVCSTAYSSTLIDFESQPVDGWVSGVGPVIDNDFILDNVLEMGIADWGGNKQVHWCTSEATCGANQPVTVSNINGYNFDLLSLDFAEVENSTIGTFTFTGHLAAGGTVQTSIVNTDIVYSDGTGSMVTVLFDSSWSGLSSFDIGYALGIGFDVAAIDNIAVNVVPIPAAVWLFGSALAGLGWMRRKKPV